MEKLHITTHDTGLAKTIMTIVKGELTNWGYDTSDIQVTQDSWGDGVLEIEVKIK